MLAPSRQCNAVRRGLRTIVEVSLQHLLRRILQMLHALLLRLLLVRLQGQVEGGAALFGHFQPGLCKPSGQKLPGHSWGLWDAWVYAKTGA